MKELIVIEELDRKQYSTIIGVAETMQKSIELMTEYYGEYETLGVKDVRDSGIEYVYSIKADKESYTIVFRSFNLNCL